jgi:hypothetical protein
MTLKFMLRLLARVKRALRGFDPADVNDAYRPQYFSTPGLPRLR